MPITLTPLLCVALLAACQDTAPAPPRYDLAHPAHAVELPKALREVSAVAAIDAHTVACLQDEKGTLYSVDVRTGEVTGKRGFGKKGDYEGLARVGADYYALRSDGWLGRIAAGGTEPASEPDAELDVVEKFELDLPARDLEGLCFDAARQRLLIAPKRLGKADDRDAPDDDVRRLFAFDLQTRRLAAAPALTLSVADIVEQALRLRADVPTRVTKKGNVRAHLELRFSEVAVHPVSGAIWLLSAADHALLSVDATGKLLQFYRLDAADLPQPEGLTFLPDGALVLTSEGGEGRARLRVYRLAVGSKDK